MLTVLRNKESWTGKSQGWIHKELLEPTKIKRLKTNGFFYLKKKTFCMITSIINKQEYSWAQLAPRRRKQNHSKWDGKARRRAETGRRLRGWSRSDGWKRGNGKGDSKRRNWGRHTALRECHSRSLSQASTTMWSDVKKKILKKHSKIEIRWSILSEHYTKNLEVHKYFY